MRRLLLAAAAGMMFLSGGCRWGTGENLYSGSVEMTEHALGAPAPGRLATLSVHEGDTVRKNQEIATLERFEQSKKDFERLAQLQKTGGARLQDVEHAKLAMDEQRVLSPVDGVVLLKVREIGEVLPAGAPVVTVGDPSDRWVRIYLPEVEIGRVAIGDAAWVRPDGFQREIPARVSFISPRTEFTPRNVQTREERVTQTFAVKVRLQDAGPDLRPGVFADVRLRLHDR